MCSAACRFRLNAISRARKWKREPASLCAASRHAHALPGVGPDGPTLEIFEYSEPAAGMRLPHRPGFAHIAFAVDSVAAAREQVLSQVDRLSVMS